MSDKYDAAIHEIAVRHGVVLSKDDPILILQTMNDRLIEESRQAQAAILTQFREEMESISSQWRDDAKEKAEKIINAALAGSKEAMAKLLLESTNASVQSVDRMISVSLAEARELSQQTKKFGWFMLVSSVVILAASSLCMLFLLV
ncbi:conjugal transfer protein TraM [Legionella pneumophila]|uniref:conjugal transfer protein TraM n=1 Tax=Legionella pneumophila TaxID=446 RepID=UPI000770AB9D|nr:conjugal transfer protein TraM [Legionella pneumophila]CZP95966.1 conjugal transfer protein TraM [Legionella pneumophila]